MYRSPAASRGRNKGSDRKRTGIRCNPMDAHGSHTMSHDRRQHHSIHVDQVCRDQRASDASTRTQLPNQDQEPKTLSNTQLKKMRVKEWRRKERERLSEPQGSGPLPDPPASPYNSYCPVFKSSATVSNEITKQLAIDCEMVGAGQRGCRDMLARVSVVNSFGDVVYDKYVIPIEPVTDYRSFVSGIYPQHLQDWGVPFPVVQQEVCNLLKDRVLVGHAIKHDLRVLYLQHPSCDIRDTSTYFDAAVYGGRGTPSLRKLTEHFVGVSIQSCAHDSVEDARATMRLYCLFKKDWEAKLAAGK